LRITPLAVVLCCLSLSGCFPYHYTIQPGISGTVVAAPGSDPLPGAQVTLSVGKFFSRSTVIETSTDAQGRFELTPRRQWGVFVAGQEPLIRGGCEVSVNAQRFEKVSRHIRCSEMGPATTGLGKITLEPTP
jgi:hypothetical protein